MGADAVINATEERLPGYGTTRWRWSGVAIHTADDAARADLVVRWYSSQARWLTRAFLLLLLAHFLHVLLITSTIGGLIAFWRSDESRQDLGLSLAGQVMIHALPLIALFAYSRWKSPQLFLPAAFCVLVPLLRDLAGGILLLCAAMLGAPETTIPGLIVVLYPPIWMFLVAWWLLIQRGKQVHRQFLVAIPPDEQDVARSRRIGARVLWGFAVVLHAAVLLTVVVWVYLIWRDAEDKKDYIRAQYLQQSVQRIESDPVGAERDLREAIRLYEKLLRSDPDNLELQQVTAATRLDLGFALLRSGQLDPAKKECRTALNSFESLPHDMRSSPIVRRKMGLCEYYLGAIALDSGYPAQAQLSSWRALELLADIALDDPEIVLIRMRCRENVAFAEMNTGPTAKGLAELQKVLADYQRLPADMRALPLTRHSEASSRLIVALSHAELGHDADAEREGRAAFTAFDRLVMEMPRNPKVQAGLTQARDLLQQLEARKKR